MAAKTDAFTTAFCISTDATGICVKPEPSATRARQPCRRGHFFVMLADRDHVIFEYTARETSDAVREMFRGYSGYLQADAKSTYEVLFRKCASTRCLRKLRPSRRRWWCTPTRPRLDEVTRGNAARCRRILEWWS
jgi:hypothetical protein